VQDCASREAWPLASIAQSVADEEPDAVIFNGDFFYREAACPSASQAECGSSPPPVGGLPFTDSAYGWLADVLVPMTPLLAKAPLVVTRGNHEACNRGGNGYFLLFDPRSGTEGTCAPVAGTAGLAAPDTVPTATYAIDLHVSKGRTLRLAIVDSAGGSDTHADAFAAVQRPTYAAAAALTRARPGRESWLVTHRPVYAYVTSTFAQPGVPFNPWSSVDQTAASFGLLGTYDLVFSSHLHLAQAVQIPGQPGQLVLGNGGTLLDPAIGYELPTSGPTGAAGQAYPAPSWAWVAPRFGYAIATPGSDAGTWRIRMMDPLGRAFARCGVRARALFCSDTPPSNGG
jgi:3',5'-cyclic AMP phosphodiesterase CpdA